MGVPLSSAHACRWVCCSWVPSTSGRVGSPLSISMSLLSSTASKATGTYRPTPLSSPLFIYFLRFFFDLFSSSFSSSFFWLFCACITFLFTFSSLLFCFSVYVLLWSLSLRTYRMHRLMRSLSSVAMLSV